MSTFPEPIQWNGPDTREMHEPPEQTEAAERAAAIDRAATKLLEIWRIDEPVAGEHVVIYDYEFAWKGVTDEEVEEICGEAEDRTEYAVSFEPRKRGEVWCRRNGTGDDAEERDD